MMMWAARAERLAARPAIGRPLGSFTRSVMTAGDESAVKNVLAQSRPTVLYFTATWCGPCRMIAPIFSALAKDFPGANFVKIDVDELPEVAQARVPPITRRSRAAPPLALTMPFTQEHGVSAMPTFKFYTKTGDCVETVVGADPVKLKAGVQRHASS